MGVCLRTLYPEQLMRAARDRVERSKDALHLRISFGVPDAYVPPRRTINDCHSPSIARNTQPIHVEPKQVRQSARTAARLTISFNINGPQIRAVIMRGGFIERIKDPSVSGPAESGELRHIRHNYARSRSLHTATLDGPLGKKCWPTAGVAAYINNVSAIG